MQRCDYCGRDNDDAAQVCSGCGTSFPPAPQLQGQSPVEEVAAPPEIPQLNASRATGVLLIYLGAQFFISLLVAVFGAIVAVARGQNLQDPNVLAEFTKQITAIAVPISIVGGGVAMVLGSFILVRTSLKDGSPSGAAWRFGSGKEVALGFGLGAASGLVYVGIGLLAIGMGVPHRKPGALGTMAITPGLPHALWLLSLLLLAPPFEEFLFRGILYGGYCRSLGQTKAVVLTTFIFSLLHITEWIYFLPALIGITGLALVAVWMRLRSAAIGPSIAAHFGYNASLAVLLNLFLTFGGLR